jgi:hypothetical protein
MEGGIRVMHDGMIRIVLWGEGLVQDWWLGGCGNGRWLM